MLKSNNTEFCSTVNKNSNMKTMWKIFKNFKNRQFLIHNEDEYTPVNSDIITSAFDKIAPRNVI